MRNIIAFFYIFIIYGFIAITPSCGKANNKPASDKLGNESSDGEAAEEEEGDENLSSEEEEEITPNGSSRKTEKKPVTQLPVCNIQSVGVTSTATSSNVIPVAMQTSTLAAVSNAVRGINEIQSVGSMRTHQAIGMQADQVTRLQSAATNSDSSVNSLANTQGTGQGNVTPIDPLQDSQISNLTQGQQQGNVGVSANCLPNVNSNQIVTGTSTGSTVQTFNTFEELFGEAERKECNSRGFFFSRNAMSCLNDVSLAKSYECTKTGIVEKFRSVQISGVDQIFEKYIAEGFILDQCGERNGQPIASFYNKTSLRVRLICSKGDSLCSN